MFTRSSWVGGALVDGDAFVGEAKLICTKHKKMAAKNKKTLNFILNSLK